MHLTSALCQEVQNKHVMHGLTKVGQNSGPGSPLEATFVKLGFWNNQ